MLTLMLRPMVMARMDNSLQGVRVRGRRVLIKRRSITRKRGSALKVRSETRMQMIGLNQSKSNQSRVITLTISNRNSLIITMNIIMLLV
jgi:hypothetical protein